MRSKVYLLACLFLLMSGFARAGGAPQASPAAECEKLIHETLRGIFSLEWFRIEGALDDRTVAAIDSYGSRVLKLDHRGMLQFLSSTEHPARHRREIRVRPVSGTSSHFLVTVTGPYTYIDEPMEAAAPPCGYKPVELCVEMVKSSDGQSRLRLTYAWADLIYLLQ